MKTFKNSTAPIAYSYIRFSSRRQEMGDSVRRQVAMSQNYAAEHGLILDKTTTYLDVGVSAFRGANKDAGALAVFLDAVKSGRISTGSYLLVESHDRLSREGPLKALPVFLEIMAAGITIVTLIDNTVHSQERYDAEWSSIIVSLAKMAQAHDESLKKSVRLSAAWVEKRAKLLNNGAVLTAKGPGWLRYNGQRWALIDDRVTVIRRIFSEFIGGKGRGMIAAGLNADGVPAFTKNRNGTWKQWHGGTVQKVTNNAAVIGHFQPHTVTKQSVVGPDGRPMLRECRNPSGDVIADYYPAIIPVDQFLEAQVLASKKSVQPGNSGGAKGTRFSNLFSGLTRCIRCNNPMNYKDRGKRSSVVFRCRGHRNGLCTNADTYPYQPFEQGILDWMVELEIDDTRSEDEKALRTTIASLITKKQLLTARAERLTELLADGDSRFVLNHLKSLEEEIDGLDIDLRTAKAELTSLKSTMSNEERQQKVATYRLRMNNILKRAEAEKIAGNTSALQSLNRELYSIRAALNQSLRSIIKGMLFDPDTGIVGLFLNGTQGAPVSKAYIFDRGRVIVCERGADEKFEPVSVHPNGKAAQAEPTAAP